MKSRRIVARIDRTLPSFIAFSSPDGAAQRDPLMPISWKSSQARAMKLDARKRERERERDVLLKMRRLLGRAMPFGGVNNLAQLTTRVLMRANGSEFVTESERAGARARVVPRKRPFIVEGFHGIGAIR
jgi:hypothetical protein